MQRKEVRKEERIKGKEANNFMQMNCPMIKYRGGKFYAWKFIDAQTPLKKKYVNKKKKTKYTSKALFKRSFPPFSFV